MPLQVRPFPTSLRLLLSATQGLVTREALAAALLLSSVSQTLCLAGRFRPSRRLHSRGSLHPAPLSPLLVGPSGRGCPREGGGARGSLVWSCGWGTPPGGAGAVGTPHPPHWCSRPAGATRRGEGPLRREQPPPPPGSRGGEQWGAGGGAAGGLGGPRPAVPGVPGEEQARDPRLSPTVTCARLERVPRLGPRATRGCGVGCGDAGCADAGCGDAGCGDVACGMRNEE